MRVELQIARGDPTAPQQWNVGPTVFVLVFPFEARWRIAWLFDILRQLGFDHDDILVMMLDAQLTAGVTDRLRALREQMLPLQKVCLLDNGLTLAQLTPNQIRARVG